MKSPIESRVRVNANGSVVFHDARLTPGEEVQIIVKPVQEAPPGESFLAAAKRIRIEAPADFSERFDDSLYANR
jgi:hypothetical protein